MATAITMPKLGMTMEEGTVIEWRAEPGQSVEKGQNILVIESEKSEIDIEAPSSGVLRHIYIEAGEIVPCGTFLAAVTATADEAFDADAFRSAGEKIVTPAAPPETSRHDTGKASTPAASSANIRTDPTRVAVTPAARRLCKDLGLDVTKIPGSGPGARVTREDVEAYNERMESRIAVEDEMFLEVHSSGNGPRVCLLPGFGTDTSAFARQTSALEEGHTVLAVNPRGVGFSDPPCVGYDISRAATDVSVVIGEKAHLVGASLGAAVALQTAIEYPEKVESLTLITPFTEVGERLSIISELWCELAAIGNYRALALALAPWMFSAAFLSDSRRRNRAVSAIAQMSRLIPAETLELTRDSLRGYRAPEDAALAGLSLPTLVVVAGADILTPDGGSVAEKIPGAKLERIEAAGHAVALESPDEVNQLLVRHLEAVT